MTSFRNNELHSPDFSLAWVLCSRIVLTNILWGALRAMFYYRDHSYQLCISAYPQRTLYCVRVFNWMWNGVLRFMIILWCRSHFYVNPLWPEALFSLQPYLLSPPAKGSSWSGTDIFQLIEKYEKMDSLLISSIWTAGWDGGMDMCSWETPTPGKRHCFLCYPSFPMLVKCTPTKASLCVCCVT